MTTLAAVLATAAMGGNPSETRLGLFPRARVQILTFFNSSDGRSDSSFRLHLTDDKYFLVYLSDLRDGAIVHCKVYRLTTYIFSRIEGERLPLEAFGGPVSALQPAQQQ